MIKQLRNYLLFGALALSSLNVARADDIFKGVKGPTKFQLDGRGTYSKNSRNIENFTNNLILKYWDGGENSIGQWAFVNLPYKFQKDKRGFGDITMGGGPRGKTRELNWFLYGALTIPTRNKGLSNERYDIRAGTFVTYLTKDKKFHIDGTVEYNFTGKNNSGINPSNEIYSGILAGGAVSDKIRFATGLTDLIRSDGDFILNSRTVFRYTLSPDMHFELTGDIGIKNKNTPKSNSLGIFARYNF